MNIPIGQEPAFPFQCQGPTTGPEIYYGMTLRDYFAAKCLSVWVQAHIDQSVDDLDKATIAHECYAYADVMLKARESK